MLRITFNEIYPSAESGSTGRRIPLRELKLLREILNDNLTNKQKCYIMLYYRDGLNIRQIAGRFGVNKSTVSRTITRGRKKIAELLKCELIKEKIRSTEASEAEDEDEGSACY